MGLILRHLNDFPSQTCLWLQVSSIRVTSKVSKVPLKGRRLSLTQISPLDLETTLCRSSRAQGCSMGARHSTILHTHGKDSHDLLTGDTDQNSSPERHVCAPSIPHGSPELPSPRAACPCSVFFSILASVAVCCLLGSPTNLGIAVDKAQTDRHQKTQGERTGHQD